MEPRLDLEENVRLVYRYTRRIFCALAILAIIWAFTASRVLYQTKNKCCVSCYALNGCFLTFIIFAVAFPLITVEESTKPVLDAICSENFDELPFGQGKILTQLKSEGYTMRKVDDLLDSRFNILCRGLCPCEPIDTGKWNFLDARRMHRNFDFHGDISNMMECIDRVDMVGDVIAAIAGEPCIKPYCGTPHVASTWHFKSLGKNNKNWKVKNHQMS